MAKYDVFISYSRKDYEEVRSFKEMLETRIPGINIWFDINGIESGDEFEDKIIAAIDDSERVLFFLSNNSNASKWTKDELVYAKNTDKKIVPILLRGVSLRGWFLYKFGRVDSIDSTNKIQIDKLVRELLGRGNKTVVKDKINITKPIDVKPEPLNVSNGHEFVDLGLSVKWATCNVGASSPEEYGDYFAWGEITTKSKYTEENSITLKKDLEDITGNSLHDAAQANWGGSWRLPTKSEIDLLAKKCLWKWTKQGGCSGFQVIGPNGNSIFLPAAGCRYEYSLNFAGLNGYYWSSESYDNEDSYGLFFDSNSHYKDSYDRFYGLSVRPVID